VAHIIHISFETTPTTTNEMSTTKIKISPFRSIIDNTENLIQELHYPTSKTVYVTLKNNDLPHNNICKKYCFLLA